MPDDTIVSTLSIPGTHNSGAFFKLSAPSVRCQGESILEQLNNGVRFLDFRLSKDYMSRGEKVNDIMIVHGKFPVKLSGSYKFKQALKDVYKFLNKNPTETILISIKFENTMLNWNSKIDEFSKILFEKFIGHNRNQWYLSDKIPTLKYARGKAILLRRFPVLQNGIYKKFGIPCIWESSDTLLSNANICVQDYFDIKNSNDIDKKANLIKDMIYKAKYYHSDLNSRKSSNTSYEISDEESLNSGNNSNNSLSSSSSLVSFMPLSPKLFINFCTGASYLHKNYWPSKVDKQIREYDIDQHYTKNCGILVLDFADRDNWKLVKKLVDVNID